MRRLFLGVVSLIGIYSTSYAHAHEFLICAAAKANAPATSSKARSNKENLKLIREILDRFRRSNPETFSDLPEKIRLVQANLPNASINRYGLITLTSALFDVVTSEDELAFVLAHEIAHWQLGHPRGALAAEPASEELAADRGALTLLAGAGYDLSSGPRVLRNIAISYDLNSQERIQRLNFILARIENLSSINILTN